MTLSSTQGSRYHIHCELAKKDSHARRGRQPVHRHATQVACTDRTARFDVAVVASFKRRFFTTESYFDEVAHLGMPRGLSY